MHFQKDALFYINSKYLFNISISIHIFFAIKQLIFYKILCILNLGKRVNAFHLYHNLFMVSYRNSSMAIFITQKIVIPKYNKNITFKALYLYFNFIITPPFQINSDVLPKPPFVKDDISHSTHSLVNIISKCVFYINNKHTFFRHHLCIKCVDIVHILLYT